MEAGRVTLSIVLATILTLSTLVAPTAAQVADDPKQPSETNNTMVILGSQDLANCFMHFDANDTSGSADEGYGQKDFSEGSQVNVMFNCQLEKSFIENLYLRNGSIVFDFTVNIDSMDCDDNSDCTNLTVTISKGQQIVKTQEWPVDQVNSANDVNLEMEITVDEMTNTWNKSSQEPFIEFEYSAPGWTTVDCVGPAGFLQDCSGYFRLYYYTVGNNTGTVEFPVANMTDPNNPGGDGIGGGGSSDSGGLPGFGLMAGVSALAMAAVAVSRKSEE
ncbi:MAG: hypothetical protein ACJZ46_03820 [Candidatus Thalassarchaeaceae archaeon]